MKYKLKQGEGKVFAFSITKGGLNFETLDGVAGLTFVVKKNKKDTTALITKTKDDFTITQNVAKLPVTSNDTKALEPGSYVGELTITVAASDTSKSADILVEIERAVAVA